MAEPASGGHELLIRHQLFGFMEEREYLIALNMIPGIGRVLFQRLVDCFGKATAAFKASSDELQRVEGIGPKIAAVIVSFPVEKLLTREIEQARRRKVRILVLSDEEYPVNLKSIFDPPPVLYVKGKIEKQDMISIAIVGTRTPTAYGKEVSEKFASQLAEFGVTVVSGLARGVDSWAHRGAVKQKGRTIAVLGCGLDVIYPPENSRLYEEIFQRGAIISEFPFGVKPEKIHFPLRNRIISGMTLGTLVVEAAARSGSLITAHLALEQGREVFAVPGKVTSLYSQGTNWLIKNGAKLVSSIEDIIEELPFEVREVLHTPAAKQAPKSITLEPKEQNILSLIDFEETHIDAITMKSALPPSEVAAILMVLEIQGLIKQYPGKYYVRL